jgi:ribonucleoside-diphosphate reductase alpha chain
MDNLNRRETWKETVQRYVGFLEKHLDTNTSFKLDARLREDIEEAILKHEVMPSMRLMMTAGVPAELDNICAYNCCYIALNRPEAFDECLYVLMNGTGVGFSCESIETNQLPEVPDVLYPVDRTIVVKDSKLGWAKAYRELLQNLWSGNIPNVDYSNIRPAGARLLTFGGRASGPDPLERLFHFTIEAFKKAEGRKLKPVEVNDIACMIGACVEVGGVRRSALISLSDLFDGEMRVAKKGEWWREYDFRSQANNSAVYDSKPSIGHFMREWLSLYDSKSGERGIFNREACKHVMPERRDSDYRFGTNPCSEIILRDKQFCNLTEVVVRAHDTISTVARKVEIATILGTFQSSLTDFKHIHSDYEKNCREEALLGVSLTGIMDNTLMSTAGRNLNKALDDLRDIAIETNSTIAEEMGINKSTAITCVKPSGTVSQLVDSASGIHPRHSQYYIRRVRGDVKDPLTQFMISAGFPNEPCVHQPDHVVIFEFPQKSPEGCTTRNDITSIEHLELWLTYQKHWCEHKPSITISVKEDEWMEVGSFVWKHFDYMSGVSFLPHSDHNHSQLPYEDCSEEDFLALIASMPTLDSWEGLSMWETEDTTKGVQTAACASGQCEFVDI